MKKTVIILSIILVIILSLLFIPKPQFEGNNPFLSTDGYPLVMAHAGGKGIYPDNTMKAYEYSYSVGVDVLEMDVQLTKDGVLVLLHGANGDGSTSKHSNCDTYVWEENYIDLYNTCNFGYNYQESDETYLYREMTALEWQSEKVHLPTLEEVFDSFGDNVMYNIEIKAFDVSPRTEIADKLAEMIYDYELEDLVLIGGQHDDIADHILDNYPDLYISASVGYARNKILSAYSFTTLFGGKPKIVSLEIPTSYELPVINTLKLDTRLLVNSLHNQNISIQYWTINSEEEMRHLIEIGCDGIITDYPELLQSIIQEYKDAEQE